MKLRRLKFLSEGAIRFSIDEPIISQAHIDARRAELLPVQRASMLEEVETLLGLIAFSSLAIAVLMAAELTEGFDLTRLLILAISLVVAVTGILMILPISKSNRIKEQLRKEFNALAPMESARCIELLRLSKADAEVDAYRRRVIAERVFVEGEYEMLVDHASRAEERAACKELYEVAA